MVAVGASHIEGRGLFADRPHEPGELVHRLGGRRASTFGVAVRIATRRIRWDDPLQIGRVTYLVLDPVSLAANHSCDPNLGLRGQGDLVALRTIAAGDELTYDYSLTVPRSIFTRGWRLACACSQRHAVAATSATSTPCPSTRCATTSPPARYPTTRWAGCASLVAAAGLSA